MAGLDSVNSVWPFDSHSPPLPIAEEEDSSASTSQVIYPSAPRQENEAALPSSADELSADDEQFAMAIAPPAEVTPEHYFEVVNQLAQIRALECRRIRRIYQLEQALDQAMIYLEELKIKVRDYEHIQAQLSVTEDFAYVQQHAIARLKAQIHEQKQAIFTQSADAREYDDAVQTVFSYTEQLAEYQQAELEHLKVRLAHDQAAEHQRQHRLEKQVERLQATLNTQQEQIHKQESSALAARTLSASLEVQLEASQQQVKHLSTRLAESQTQLAALHQQVSTLDAVVAEKKETQDALQRAQQVIAEQNHHIAMLKRDAALAATQAERLDQEKQQQLRAQERWQYRCLSLEQERDRHAQRADELVQQASEMQEDILSYARQAGEYEAAVQFWKERYHAGQRQLNQLKELFEQQVPYLSDEATAELQAALELTLLEHNDTSSPPAVSPKSPFSVLEMPEFLLRRYAFRNIRRVRSLTHAESNLDSADNAEP